jgi:hypothetical protein
MHLADELGLFQQTFCRPQRIREISAVPLELGGERAVQDDHGSRAQVLADRIRR